ncbi:NAD(P)/FAD-dependent oxidoreductase [Microbacterium telephonicum]|uniref:Sulfide:quinone oxidoreductase n=1 Tax=Microbacterium telephonicum TaxID=1714841 RepID=A0A498CAP7_9MICO|nr:FAD-dependent oxidoreductase [Microbacterium telephonicum]RLK52573.1 sulfide:quinone oxidoreductase [Microbacterium telephonicum]
MTEVRDHQVVVIGGGNGGISVAARLRRRGVDDIAVIEPRDRHVYQPLLSHVAGGVARLSETVRDQADVIPPGVTWIHDAVTAIDPESSTVQLGDGGRVRYGQLIVSPGIHHEWDAVPGAREARASGRVASHYDPAGAAALSPMLRDLRSGTVVFTQPDEPSSCPGAAQKPMYLACDYWRAHGVRDGIRVLFVTAKDSPSGMAHIDAELSRVIERYGIEVRYGSRVRAVDSTAGTLEIEGPHGSETVAFDVADIVPPQSAPPWLRNTGLAAHDDPGGFVEVDPRTLRHARYANVWSLGDAAGTRNAKSGGALRKQTYVVAENVAAAVRGEAPAQEYDGYTVCPYTVSRRSVVWAEFDEAGRPKPTIPFWRGMYRESRLSWVFDRHILPWVYWNLILTGRV